MKMRTPVSVCGHALAAGPLSGAHGHEDLAPVNPSAEPPPYGEKTSGQIRLLIVDDHELVRRGIRDILRRFDEIVVIGEGQDGEEAIEMIRRLSPDVVLLDLRMPKLGGVATLRRLSDLGVETPAIVLSAYHDADRMFDALSHGARGYLKKTVSSNELASAIMTVHKGGTVLPAAILDRLRERSRTRARLRLTRREREVLSLLEAGLSNKEISARLRVTVRTARFHIDNLHQKLGVHSRTRAVHVGRKLGLLRNQELSSW